MTFVCEADGEVVVEFAAPLHVRCAYWFVRVGEKRWQFMDCGGVVGFLSGLLARSLRKEASPQNC